MPGKLSTVPCAPFFLAASGHPTSVAKNEHDGINAYSNL
jgi:hypothetical protein